MHSQHDSYVEIANGEIQMWVEQGQSVCLRAISRAGDPVELAGHEVRELIRQLEILAKRADG